MNDHDWRIRTARRPLYDAAGERVMALPDRHRRTIWIDPDVRAEERPALVRDALAAADAELDAAPVDAMPEQLPAAENKRLADDFATAVWRICGSRPVMIRGLPFAMVPVRVWPKGRDGAGKKLVIDLTARRVFHADHLTPTEIDALLARARRLVESDRNEGRAAA